MKFEDIVGLTAYANLDRREDRKEFMEFQLNRAGIEAHRIAAVDGRKPLPVELTNLTNGFDNPAPAGNLHGMQGALYSFALALCLGKVSQAPAVLYFEDDAVIPEDFKASFAKAMKHAPEDWQVINFGPWVIESGFPVSDSYETINLCLNAHCVLVKQSVFDFLIEGCALNTCGPDWLLTLTKNLRSYTSTSWRIPQKSGYSDTTFQFLGTDAGRVDPS